jgi:hypothetical protein
MTVRRRPRVAGLLGLLALIGSATVLPYLHTCFPSAAAPLAARSTDDHETSGSTHGGCAVCALASTVRMSPAMDAGPIAPPRERTLLATSVPPPLLAFRPEASANPRAPPSFS